MTNKTVPELREEAKKTEQAISELISTIQKKYDIVVTDIKLDHSFAASRFTSPMKTVVEIEIKLK